MPRSQPLHPVLGGARGGVAATIGSAPKKYSAEEAEQRAALSALRREEAAAAEAEAAAAGAEGRGRGEQRRDRDFRSVAVPVEAVIANPSLNLPRDKQERKARIGQHAGAPALHAV